MPAPTKKDWGHIHAKAWKDAAFRKLLETDPKKAIDLYGKEKGKTFSKIVKIGPKPKGVHKDDLAKHASAIAPPACC